MGRFAAAAYALAAGGIATAAGLVGAILVPIPGLTLNVTWALDTIVCAAFLGLGFALGVAVGDRIGRDDDGEA